MGGTSRSTDGHLISLSDDAVNDGMRIRETLIVALDPMLELFCDLHLGRAGLVVVDKVGSEKLIEHIYVALVPNFL